MRNLYIIVEGPDNVGKSTLIQNIKNHFNNFTMHSLHYSNVRQDSPEAVIEYSENLYAGMFEIMVNQSRFKNSGVICDRSHLGEMVYGPIYREYSGEYVLDIEKSYQHLRFIWDNLVLVTLIDEPTRLVARDDGLSFSTDLSKKTTEINNFITAHEKSNIQHKLLLNIKEHDANAAMTAVVEFIKGRIK
jgi:nicotinamide riboside kinase